jgi:hypothetical protein
VSLCLSLLLRPARYGLAVQRVADHDRLRIHSIGSLRKVALLSHLEKSVGVPLRTKTKDVSGGSSGDRTLAIVLSNQEQPNYAVIA